MPPKNLTPKPSFFLGGFAGKRRDLRKKKISGPEEIGKKKKKKKR